MILFAVVWSACIITSFVIGWRHRTGGLRWGFATLFLGPFGILLAIEKARSRRPADDAGQLPRPRALIVPTDAAVAAFQFRTGDRVEGLRAYIDIQDTGIKICRDEAARNVLLHGFAGEKSISYRSISAIQLRMPTNLISGYVQFSIVGGIEGGRGIFQATRDENSVMFTDEQSAAMLAFRTFVERRIEAAHASQQGASSLDVAKELMKLAALRDQGILAPEEFATRKAKLLE